MDRKTFLASLASLTAGVMVGGISLPGSAAGSMSVKELADSAMKLTPTPAMPALFLGHGSPTNAIEKNDFTAFLQKLGAQLPRPNAILVVSAHWETDGTYVTGHAKPATIYDFYGFPQAMYQLRYPAAGSPANAEVIKQTAQASGTTVQIDPHRGFDHGAWALLLHLYPKADIPVLQLSLNTRLDAKGHAALAAELRPLRERGFLILGSGNVVHNLGQLDWAGGINAPVMDWAAAFDERTRVAVENGNTSAVISPPADSITRIAHPTIEHYLPLTYLMGLRNKDESIRTIFHSIQYGSISMRCFQLG